MSAAAIEIVEATGAVSGTLSHAAATPMTTMISNE
jgi:hypothetical protein